MQVKKKAIENRIFEAGKREFLEKGYQRSSVSRISESAGVPVGNFYRYFDGKKGLLKASEIFCLSDFFSFSLDSHTLLGKIYKRFNDLLCDDFPLRLTVDEQLRLLRQHLENLVRSSTADFCFAEQIDYKDLFSALKISPLCLSDEIDQRLIQFLNLCSELNLYKAVVLIQPKAYISEEKLQKVYSCALANRIGLVVLECVCRKNVLKHEKKICILRDFSDIII